jgi:hypothetical protein
VCDIPDQAAHYHTLGPKVEAAYLSRHLAGLRVKVFLVFSVKEGRHKAVSVYLKNYVSNI